MSNLKKYSIYEFIDKVKSEPLKWIGYCEIIILRSGLILICNPSHTETAINYVKDKYHMSREDIFKEISDTCLPLEWIVDKYNLVAYWYNGYMEPSRGLNRFQRKTIDILKHNNLLSDSPYIDKATEYTLHLYRKEHFEIE